MKLSFESAQVTGNPDRGRWTQLHVFNPDNSDKANGRGAFFAVISMNNLDRGYGIQSVSVAREILAKLHDEYYGELSGSAFQALVDGVSRVYDEYTTTNGTIELCCASIVDDYLNIACTNKSLAILCRDGVLVELNSSASQNVCSVSGRIKDGDLLIFGTADFRENFNKEFINNIVGEPAEMADKIEDELLMIDKSEGIGGLFIKIVDEGGMVNKISTNEKREVVGERGSVRKGLVSLIDKIIAKLPDRRIRVGNDTVEVGRTRKKTAPLVGVLLMVILGMSIFFGVFQRREKNKKAVYESKLIEAQHKLDEASGLASINKNRSRELVLSAQDEVNGIIESGVDDPEVIDLSKKIDEKIGEIAGIYKPKEELFLDLGLISSGFRGDFMLRAGDRLLVLDKAGKRLAAIGISNKRTEIVSNSEYISNAISAAGYDERSFILSSDGIREVTNDPELIIKPEWDTNNVLIYAFAGNMYVLDRSENVIWRYPGVRLGFSEKQNWLGSGVNADFSDAIDWSIDGMIWVLYSDNTISKFSQGVALRFNLSMPDEKLVELTNIYTSDSDSRLYILDKLNKRVIVFTKEGEYVSEYINDMLGGASEIVASEEYKKLIFLNGDKLYEIELN
jgi:hypothetical protein